MFNLGALTILTLFNILFLTQFVSTTLAPAGLPHLLRQGTAALCLVISAGAFALGLFVHQPEVSVATITTAACINLLILFGSLTNRLQGPQALNQLHSVNGLARLYFTGESSERTAIRPAQITISQPLPVAPTPVIRGARPLSQPAATRTTSRPLSMEELAKAPSRPRPHTSGRLPATRVEQAPQNLVHLAPRRTYTVPHRPNRITANLGALQLTPESASALNSFAQSASQKPGFAALATPRIRLVHPVAHNKNVLPLILSDPDPAWQTTFGRIAALARSA